MMPATTRSGFLLRGTLAAGAALAAGPWVGRALAQRGAGDLQVISFLLSHELVTASFYARGLSRSGLLAGDLRTLVSELRDHEDVHVEALSTELRRQGGSIPKPANIAVDDAYRSTSRFVRYAIALEEVAVGAYNGALPLLEDPKAIQLAGAIVNVEARHAALLRVATNRDPAPVTFDEPLDDANVRRAFEELV